MKKLGSLPIGLSFAGCFLGVGCMSGAEVFQFFGTFGIPGFVGVFFAVTGLALLNLAIAYIVGKTGDAGIDRVVVGAPRKMLLSLTGGLEILIFFGTYVVTAAGAGALLEMLTGLPGAHLWGSFLFCFLSSGIRCSSLHRPKPCIRSFRMRFAAHSPFRRITFSVPSAFCVPSAYRPKAAKRWFGARFSAEPRWPCRWCACCLRLP